MQALSISCGAVPRATREAAGAARGRAGSKQYTGETASAPQHRLLFLSQAAQLQKQTGGGAINRNYPFFPQRRHRRAYSRAHKLRVTFRFRSCPAPLPTPVLRARLSHAVPLQNQLGEERYTGETSPRTGEAPIPGGDDSARCLACSDRRSLSVSDVVRHLSPRTGSQRTT